MTALRPNPAQRRALRWLARGGYRYDPTTAATRRPDSSDEQVIPRALMDVLVARGWARWTGEDGATAEITPAGVAATAKMPRRPR